MLHLILCVLYSLHHRWHQELGLWTAAATLCDDARMTPVTESIYRTEGDRIIPSQSISGPWDPSLQHGAGPAALIAWAAERVPTAVPMQVVRLTIDLLRPVPIVPLEIDTTVVREGKKIQVCAIRLLSNGIEVVRATVLKIRIREVELPSIEGEPLDLPLPESGSEPSWAAEPQSGFLRGVSLREVKGGFRDLGPAAIWFRVNWPMIDGAPPSPLMRAAMTADFGNGTSCVLDFRKWTFINGDLTVSLSRLPSGDWIMLDAQTSLGPAGSAIMRGRLADRNGYFGVAMQSIVIEPR